jgi:hypothetical protein
LYVALSSSGWCILAWIIDELKCCWCFCWIITKPLTIQALALQCTVFFFSYLHWCCITLLPWTTELISLHHLLNGKSNSVFYLRKIWGRFFQLEELQVENDAKFKKQAQSFQLSKEGLSHMLLMLIHQTNYDNQWFISQLILCACIYLFTITVENCVSFRLHLEFITLLPLVIYVYSLGLGWMCILGLTKTPVAHMNSPLFWGKKDLWRPKAPYLSLITALRAIFWSWTWPVSRLWIFFCSFDGSRS